MLYRIQIDQRLDKKRTVIEAVKELTSDFVILSGTAYFNGSYRPCQIVEISHEKLWPYDVSLCAEKLKKILNMPHILVTKTETEWVLY